MKKLYLALVLLICSTTFSFAQAPTRICIQNGNSCQDVGPTNPFPTTNSGYPVGSTAFHQNAAGTTGAVIATVPAVAGKTAYVCGYMFASGGFTAASMVTATISNLLTTGANLAYNHPSAGQGVLGASLAPACIPASAANTSVVATLPGGGAGTTPIATVEIWGYYL